MSLAVSSDGEILLIDEIHTPDSSRYWLADSYAERLAAGQEPKHDRQGIFSAMVPRALHPYKDAVLPVRPTT